METANKNDFVELKFTGYVQGNIFDSNIEEDLKKINPEGKAKETIIVIGQEMVVPGLDKALEGKEIGKKYEVTLSANEGFGPRKREMVKTVPLKTFTEHKINPYPGLMLTLDNALVRISAVTGARVLVDFNNPLAGKELHYAFTIVRKVSDDKEKARALFEGFLRFVPEFDVSEKVIVKGPKFYESIVKAIGEKFKELMGKELAFELKELPKEEEKGSIENDKKEEDKVDENKDGHEHGHEAIPAGLTDTGRYRHDPHKSAVRREYLNSVRLILILAGEADHRLISKRIRVNVKQKTFTLHPGFSIVHVKQERRPGNTL